MLTAARLREDVDPADLDWITALRAPQVKTLVRGGDLQLSLFDVQDLAEITSPDFPGERLVACMNSDSCRSPPRTSALTCGARSAVIQSRPAGSTSSRSRAAVSMPRSPTSTTRVSPNRSLTLSIWAATVAGSPVLPGKTSMATGMPSLDVSSP